MTDRTLRLVFLADGGSIHTQRWVEWFVRRGHQVTVVTDGRYLGDPVVQAHVVGPVGRLKRSPLALHRLRREVQALRPDVVHGHFLTTFGHIGALLRLRTPLVLSAWGSDVYHQASLPRFNQWLTRWALRRADWVTADSDDLVAGVRALGVQEDRASLVRFGVDCTAFAPRNRVQARERFGLPQAGRVVLSSRSLRPIYNIDLVVRAFAAGAGASDLLVVKDYRGDEATIAQVRALVAEIGIEDRVRWLTEIDHDDMPWLYAAADVVLSLATTDSAPVTVLEALACGVPVLATDLPSIRDWLGEGTRWQRCVALDTDTVAAALRDALSDPAPPLLDGRARVQADADFTTTMLAVEARYAALAGRSTASRH